MGSVARDADRPRGRSADIEGVLRAAIAGALGLELAVRLLVGLGLLQRGDLALGEDEALLRHLGLERLQPVLHGPEVMPTPDRAHPERRDRHAALQQVVGDAHLAPGRLLDRQGDDGLLDLRRHSVLQDRLAARQLLQSELAAFVVKLLEAIEAVARVAHHLAGLRDVAELLGKFEQSHFGADDLLILGHDGVLWKTPWRGLRNPDQLRPRHGSRRASGNTVRQIKSKLSQMSAAWAASTTMRWSCRC